MVAIASVLSMSVVGVEGHVIEVESHVGPGLVQFTLVGLPDASLKESKDRVRSAVQACGLHVPDQRVTVNLSPAGIPKSGSACDAAIALAVLIAAGNVRAGSFVDTVVLSELGLDGAMRPIRGILPAVLGAAAQGLKRVIVSADNADEAGMVPGVEVLSFAHLAQVIRWAGGQAEIPYSFHARRTVVESVKKRSVCQGDLADVHGQENACRALEIAAAGGHHVHLVGEAGSGKTMLAQRLPGILPPLSDEVSLEVTAIHSVAGLIEAGQGLIRQAPFSAPHHSMTMAAMIGGGSSIPRPGAVTLAHGGVLFLDEAPEFAPSVLDTLRQPLEDGVVNIYRAKGATSYPARFQMLLASNPCPCGNYGSRRRHCTCSSLQVRRYHSRLSGPLRDRVDMTIPMHTPTQAQLRAHQGDSTRSVRERVEQARERMAFRLRDTPWSVNTQLPGRWLREASGVSADIRRHLDTATDKGILSMRGADRVLRLMWTLADLDGRSAPDVADLGQALSLRTGGDIYGAF